MLSVLEALIRAHCQGDAVQVQVQNMPATTLRSYGMPELSQLNVDRYRQILACSDTFKSHAGTEQGKGSTEGWRGAAKPGRCGQRPSDLFQSAYPP